VEQAECDGQYIVAFLVIDVVKVHGGRGVFVKREDCSKATTQRVEH